MSRWLLALALCAANSHAYLGTFDPYPQHPGEGFRRIVFIDSQWSMALCLGAMGCAYREQGTNYVIAPISRGVGQAVNLLSGFATPDALLSHELRHAFDGDYHDALLPFVDLPPPDARRKSSDTSNGAQ